MQEYDSRTVVIPIDGYYFSNIYLMGYCWILLKHTHIIFYYVAQSFIKNNLREKTHMYNIYTYSSEK